MTRYSADRHLPSAAQLNALLRKAGWSAENWDQIRQNPDCEIVTAWNGEECVGMGTLLALWPSANLGTVSVDPGHEGSGIGGAIASHLVEIARGKDCIEVTSDTDNDRMRKILSRLEFAEIRRDGAKTFYRKNLSTLTL